MDKILRNDLRRAFLSWRFLFGVAGVTAAAAATRMQMAYILDVLYAFEGIHIRSMILITFVFCAYPGVGMMLDELRNRYWIQMVLRSGIRQYAVSKILVCILSALLTMFAGKGFYLLLLVLKYPLIDYSGSAYLNMTTNGNYPMLSGRHAGLFFFSAILLTALLAAILTLCSMLCILCFRISCITALSIPIVLFYFINTYFIRVMRLPDQFNIASVFSIFYNVMGHEGRSVLYAVGFAGVCYVLLGCVIVKVLTDRVRKGEF